MSDLNSTLPRGDFGDWPDELPEQFGGQRTTLFPGIYTFLLPATLDKLWHDVKMKDGRKLLSNGQPNPLFEKEVVRKSLKLDRNNPLIVQGGKNDGDAMTVTISTNPRPRGKKDDPKTQWVADAAYLLRTCLADVRKVANEDEVVAAINQHGGKPIRLETGLTGQCRTDKERYIAVQTGTNPDGTPIVTNMKDPSGAKGCGKRFYTDDFKNPETGAWELEVACECGDPTTEQAAAGVEPVTVVIRGFESIERFLPPLGQQ